MLYERWREIARANPRGTALIEASTGQRWTFAELGAAADEIESADRTMTYACGAGAVFVIQVLAAWRQSRPVCPLEPQQEPPPLPSLPPACAHVKLTSATTGRSKAILFTGPQLAADADQIVSTMGLRAGWPNLGAISLAHSYGFSNLVTPLLLRGIPLILAGSPLPEALRRAARQADHLTLPAVPALWRTWLDAHSIPDNVRLAISAGAPLPLALERRVFTSTGIKIHNFYGASECGGIAYDRTEDPRDEPACVGAPLDGVRVRIGEDGCLEVRSAAAGQTYWPEPDPRLAQGCFRSSDLAQLRDGQVLLIGRTSDLINVAGRKLAPEVIEQALAAHPQVRACLAFGIPSAGPERSEDAVMLVSTRGAPDLAELQRFLHERLPAWQVPREWRVVEGLAENPRGKFSRAEWKERFLSGRWPEK